MLALGNGSHLGKLFYNNILTLAVSVLQTVPSAPPRSSFPKPITLSYLVGSMTIVNSTRTPFPIIIPSHAYPKSSVTARKVAFSPSST